LPVPLPPNPPFKFSSNSGSVSSDSIDARFKSWDKFDTLFSMSIGFFAGRTAPGCIAAGNDGFGNVILFVWLVISDNDFFASFFKTEFILKLKIIFYKSENMDRNLLDNQKFNMTKQNSDVFSYGKKWFYRLKGDGGLFDSIGSDQKVSSLIVCFVNGQDIRYYTCFDSFIECVQTMLRIPVEKRSFHEVVLEYRNQKMRFDVDIKKDCKYGLSIVEEQVQSFMDELIQAIIDTYEEIGYQIVPSKNILLFTSHGKDKWSYHVVIDGFYCENCQEAKALYRSITMKMKSDNMHWLDESIYNPNHSLRILLSSKSGRIKTLEKEWKFKDQMIRFEYSEKPRNDKHQMVLEFERSFISLTENCFPIPCMVKKDLHPMQGADPVCDQVLDYSYRLFCSIYGNVFVFAKSVSNFVLLERRVESGKKIESGCPICNRVHESENAFLVIKTLPKENGITRHQIYFYCRRESGKKILIGEKVVVDTEEKLVVENKTKGGFRLSDLMRVAKNSL
jgi:hypothetical protein